jgi:hypothetical protein
VRSNMNRTEVELTELLRRMWLTVKPSRDELSIALLRAILQIITELNSREADRV